MHKATAVAPSNIAFIKYWGKRNKRLRIPENGSLSMCLDGLVTTTTVEFSDRYKGDQVTIDDVIVDGREKDRVVQHLEKVRELVKVKLRAKVVSKNSFPKRKGLSSSASGFAALSLAATQAVGLKLSEKRLSMLARLGSGSACRSIPSGYVEWMAGKNHETSYAKTIFPVAHWRLVDLVVMTESEKKHVSSTEGHKLASLSPFYTERHKLIPRKLKRMKELIKQKNFSSFGLLCELEALELHAIMLTSNPPLLYWQPASVRVMRVIQAWRLEGLESYFTVNTGQDIHVFCLEKNAKRLKSKLERLEEVGKVLVCRPGKGTKLIEKHLF